MKETKNEENKFENTKTEELEKKLKTKNTLHGLMIGIWILGLILYAYLTVTEDYEISGAFIVIAICLIGGMASNYNELKTIKYELNTRGGKHNS